VRQSAWSQRAAPWVLGSLAVFGVYLCITAIAEVHRAWEFVFPSYIASSEFREFLGRGRGPYLNPVANGLVQSLGLFAALVCWPRSNLPVKALLACALPVFAWGIYCTLTRSVWIGAGVGVLVVIALGTPPNWRPAALAAALVVAMVTVACSWQQFVAFKRDQDVSVEDVAESAKLRPVLATIAWHMFLDRPIFGCGFGQYIQESPAYLSDRSTELDLERARPFVQHNTFLGLLTETGLAGMGLFTAVLACWTHAAWRLWRSPGAPWRRPMGLLFLAFLSSYLTNAMFHNLAIIPMANMVLFFLGGAIIALAPRLADRSSTRSQPTHELELELAGAAQSW
jgi:O-antigen ligase